MSDRVVRARLVIEKDDYVRGMSDAAAAAKKATAAEKELKQAVQDRGRAVSDTVRQIDYILKHQGAPSFFNRDALAGMAPGAVGDVARQMGWAPTAASVAARSQPINPASKSPGGGIYGLAPLDANRLPPPVSRLLDTYGIRAPEGNRLPSPVNPNPSVPVPGGVLARGGLIQMVSQHPMFAQSGLTAASLSMLPEHELQAFLSRMNAGQVMPAAAVAKQSWWQRMMPNGQPSAFSNAIDLAAVRMGIPPGYGGPLAGGAALAYSGRFAARAWDQSEAGRFYGLSAADTTLGLASRIPGVSTAYGGFEDVSGHSQIRRETMKRETLFGERFPVEAERFRFEAASRVRQAGLAADVGFSRDPRFSPAQIRPGDLSTGVGIRATEDERRLVGLRQNAINTDRELEKTKVERIAQEKELLKLETDRRGIAEEKTKLDMEALTGNRKTLDTASFIMAANPQLAGLGMLFPKMLTKPFGATAEDITERQQEQSRRAAEAVEREKAGRERLAQLKEREANLARMSTEQQLEVRRGQLQIGQEREQQTRAGLTNLGLMLPFEREQSIQALKFVQGQGDLDMVPRDVLAQAQRAFPREVADMARRKMERSGIAPGLAKIAPLDFPVADPEKARADNIKNENEIARLLDKVRNEEREANQKTVEALAKEMARLFREQLQQLGAKVDEDLKRDQLKQLPRA